MQLKHCYLCKKKKPRSEFYFEKTRNRYQSKCKRCNNVVAIKRLRNLPKEKLRALWRISSFNSKGNHPERWESRKKTKEAIRKGIIKKLSCEICSGEAEAHHDDYSKPLEVRWLCHKHHREVHWPILISAN